MDTEPITPEALPLSRRVIMRQRWTDLAYFHWPYEPDVVQRLLPPGTRVDTHDGRAWVGLIPFVMRDVRLSGVPSVPGLTTFVEINVRTYVIDPLGRRSVWFFSLDVPRLAIVAIARSVFALPYCLADATHRVDGDHHRYELRRRWPKGEAMAAIGFRMGDAIPPDDVDDFDHFVSARWSLLTTRRGTLLHGRVHHERWPLHTVDEISIEQNVIEAAGLPSPDGTPRARYSPGVTVTLPWLERVR